jgi:hypothetical protein
MREGISLIQVKKREKGCNVEKRGSRGIDGSE